MINAGGDALYTVWGGASPAPAEEGAVPPEAEEGAVPPAAEGAVPPSAPVQMTVDPLDYGIPGAEPPLVLKGTELSEPEEYQDEWQDIQYNKWRDGQQLFLPIAPTGGYIINYSFDPARVSKWLNWGDPKISPRYHPMSVFSCKEIQIM